MPPPMLLALSAVLHLAVGARLAPHLDRLPALLLAALLLVSAIAVPLGLLARRIARPPWTDRLARVGLPFLGLFSSLFVATLLRELVLVAAWLFDLAAPGQLPPAGVEGATAAAVPVLALAATLVGFANAHRTPRIRTVEIVRDGLPPALDGFTIAQISDLHVGPTIRRRFVQRVVDAVNALEPDVVAVTGDLVDGTVSELAAEVAPLGGLAPRLGSFFVGGNHEYYAGVHPWLAQVRRLGLRVLQNEHVVLERGGATLVLAGVTDYGAGYFERSHRSDPEAALRGAPRDAALKILLAHQPRSGFAAAAAGSTCRSRATPLAGSSCRGPSSCGCSSRSRPGCTASASSSSMSAGAPATGVHPNASALPRKSPASVWSAGRPLTSRPSSTAEPGARETFHGRLGRPPSRSYTEASRRPTQLRLGEAKN